MIIWLLLFLLVTVHAANYKLEYKNNEWVQTVGGKGQYILIGSEPTVIQWCLPAGKTLTISDSTEFPTFGISAGTEEIKYNFVLQYFFKSIPYHELYLELFLSRITYLKQT